MRDRCARAAPHSVVQLTLPTPSSGISWQFLLESMSNLSASLHRLDNRHKLLVARGNPEAVLPFLWQSWGITDMYFEKVSSHRCCG